MSLCVKTSDDTKSANGEYLSWIVFANSADFLSGLRD